MILGRGRQARAGEQKLRVAVLHNIISPHVLPLFERLGAQPGIALRVYFLAETDRNRRWQTRIAQSFTYKVLPHWAIRVGRRDLHTFFVNPTVIQSLLRDGFDVIVSAGWDSFAAQAAFFLCLLLRKPYILWCGSTANEPSWRRSLSLPLVRLLVRGSSAWIAYGTRAKEYLVQLGADQSRVAVAYNTVDVDWFQTRASEQRPHRNEIRHKLGIGPGPVVLYVGQLIERKGTLDLLAAHELVVARRPDTQLVLVGYGPLESELRKHVAAARLPGVVFANHVPLDELPGYYVTADCFVLPSHEEVWGLVLNEAAACGLGVVTTEPVGASADLVEPGVNGRVVPAAAPEQLAAALVDVLDHATTMGNASTQIIRKATFEQNVSAIMGAIHTARHPRRPMVRSQIVAITERTSSTVHELVRRVPPVRYIAAKAWAVKAYWPQFRAHPSLAFNFLVADPELENYTYAIANLAELADFMANALGIERERAFAYIDELEQDDDLREALNARLRTRRDRKHIALYGRRAGWYCLVRALRPNVVVETGVHDGLGSAVLLKALERNRHEGRYGKLIGIDIDPQAGWLVPPSLRANWTLVIEDSARALPRIAQEHRVDVFVHDSWHSYAHEYGEYLSIERGLSPDGVLVSDNAHATDALSRFSVERDRVFAIWKEQPKDHFYPGAAIGLSLPKGFKGAQRATAAIA